MPERMRTWIVVPTGGGDRFLLPYDLDGLTDLHDRLIDAPHSRTEYGVRRVSEARWPTEIEPVRGAFLPEKTRPEFPRVLDLPDRIEPGYPCSARRHVTNLVRWRFEPGGGPVQSIAMDRQRLQVLLFCLARRPTELAFIFTLMMRENPIELQALLTGQDDGLPRLGEVRAALAHRFPEGLPHGALSVLLESTNRRTREIAISRLKGLGRSR